MIWRYVVHHMFRFVSLQQVLPEKVRVTIQKIIHFSSLYCIGSSCRWFVYNLWRFRHRNLSISTSVLFYAWSVSSGLENETPVPSEIKSCDFFFFQIKFQNNHKKMFSRFFNMRWNVRFHRLIEGMGLVHCIFNNYSSSPNVLWDNSGLMGYWLRGHEGERNNIVLVKSN